MEVYRKGHKMISEKIKALVTLSNKKDYEIAQALGMYQSAYSRKMSLDQWKAQDLIKIAKALGWRIAFIKGDERIYIDE